MLTLQGAQPTINSLESQCLKLGSTTVIKIAPDALTSSEHASVSASMHFWGKRAAVLAHQEWLQDGAHDA